MKDVQLGSIPRGLTNMEYCQFVGSQLGHIDALGDSMLTDPKFNEIRMECSVHHQSMDGQLVMARENPKSKELGRLDYVRDTSYSALMAGIKAKSFSLVAEEQLAVAEINAALRPYGNVPRLALDVESSAIDNILADLDGAKLKPLVQLLGLTPLVERLRTSNDAFKALFTARTSDSIAKEAADLRDLRELRRQLNVAYVQLCDYAVVMARMDVNPVFDEVVAIVNTIRSQYSAMSARRHAEHSSKDKKADEKA